MFIMHPCLFVYKVLIKAWEFVKVYMHLEEHCVVS